MEGYIKRAVEEGGRLIYGGETQGVVGEVNEFVFSTFLLFFLFLFLSLIRNTKTEPSFLLPFSWIAPKTWKLSSSLFFISFFFFLFFDSFPSIF